MTTITRVAVVIPARDEAALIGRCLTSVERAAGRVGASIHVDVIVVADGCVDDTVGIARSFPSVTVLETDGANVGAARAEGAATAIARGAEWLAHTDADSAVPPGWLTVQLGLASSGADVVVGTVRPDFRDLTSAQIDAWIRGHDAGQALGHVHGANLGVRVSSYLAAGGFRPLAEHEDNDLVERLRVSSNVLATARIDVLTSGRQVGRTDGGYARHLREDLVG